MPSAAPASARQFTPTSKHPAYVWCFVLALPLAAFSGSWELLGIRIGPDRLLFGAGLVLLLLDPWAWRERRLRQGRSESLELLGSHPNRMDPL